MSGRCGGHDVSRCGAACDRVGTWTVDADPCVLSLADPFHPASLSPTTPPRVCSARAPTVSPLHHSSGFAIQIAVEAGVVPALIPQIKEEGGSDIVVTNIKMLIP